MANFDTYIGALEIFKQVGCVGERDNWIFGGFVDKSKSAIIGSFGYERGRQRDLEISKINDYFSLLFNITENGIGLMPLTGSGLSINPQKLEPAYEGYVFYNYQEIYGISVKNFWGIRKGIKNVSIKLADNKEIFFFVHMVERFLPYQEVNTKRFVEKYQR